VSNPDWPGPYWQDDASVGRNGRRDDESAWDDAGFWRSGDNAAPQADGWQATRGAEQGRGSRRASGSGREGHGNGNGHADERPRRPSRAAAGTSGVEGNGAGRLSHTADELKSRLGIRGSAPGRGGSGAVSDATDQNFWGELQERPGRGQAGGPGRRRAAAGRADWDDGATQGGRENGSGGSGYRGARRAGDSNAAYDEDGAGQWAGRTALRDRIQDGVRSRTSTIQRRGGGSGGDGDGGDGGWDDDGGPGGGGRGGRWQQFKRYVRSGKWWRHWTWKKVLGLIGAGVAACVLIAALAMFIIYEKTPIPSAAQLTANSQSSQVYFANGKLLGTFDDTVNGINVNRTLLAEGQIPKVMTEAMTAAEDRGFYTEGGISVTGLVRSAYDDLFGSGGLQGGSTITMQYAKNRYAGVNTGQNASTKLKEIFIAMKLAHQRSKQWIITQYLNTVPFGPTTYGVAAAAEQYFSVNLTEPGQTLTFSQAAMLAAMPNQPGYFNPDPSSGAPYKALYGRWQYVLHNMVRDGNITAAQAAAAKFPALKSPPSGNGQSGYTGYLMDMVRQELETTYGYTQQQIDTKGFKITTTFSQKRIKALIRSVKAEKAQMRADGVALPYYDHIGAVLEDSKSGAIIAVYGGPGELLKNCGGQADCDQNNAEIPEPVGSSFKPIVLATAVHEGMNVFTSKLNGDIPIWVPVPQANPISNAAQTMLSPTAPPAGTSGPCNPGCFSTAPDGSSVYLKYFNNGDASGGPISVADAAANSSDPAFEDLAHTDGVQNVINMAGSLGVGSTPFQETCYQYSVPVSQFSRTAMLKKCNDLDGVFSLNSLFSPTHSGAAGKDAGTPGSPAIALGEGQLTAIEQASIFATLANGGMYHSPHVIASLSENGVKVPLKIKTRQVLSEPQAADVDYALSFDNTYGTAACTVPFRNNGGVIAKTGTLGTGADSSQAWFVGATPKGYAMSVALYTNSPGKEILNNLPGAGCLPGSQGGAWPASIWNNYFTSQWGGQTNYPTVQQALPPVNGYPFQTWTRLKPKPKKLGFCKFGQTQHCKPVNCRPGFRFGQPCTGTNPTPNPTCSFPGQPNCTNPTPNPTQTCFPPGSPCNNNPTPSPTPTPSPSPACSGPGPCNTLPAGGAAKTTAARFATPQSVAAETIALYTASLAKLERLVLVT
jgi:membrane peptidoglycan carboxypeptidase